MNAYEERKQNRIDRYREMAARSQQQSKDLISSGDKLLSHIPFGQPILVGHHSEKSDRSYRNRATSKIEKGVQASDKSAYYLGKAEAAANNNAISSDDPDAIVKLEEKLSNLIIIQDEMKKRNAYYRKHSTMKGYPDMPDDKAEELEKYLEKYKHSQPYPSYALQNNNANIKRIKQRIKELSQVRSAEIEGWDFDGGYIEMNTEYNRIQIFFDDKPDEEHRQELKMRGFKWAPSVKAWQRQLNANGLYAAKSISFIQPKCEGDSDNE